MTAQQENKEITISVIVPVHNVEAYLNECLSSLLFQPLESAEFIVVDDGSTDIDTLDALEYSIERDYKRFLKARGHT